MGQRELQDIDLRFKDAVGDLAHTSGMVNLTDRAHFEQTQFEQFNKFKEDLMKQGIMVEKQIGEDKIGAQAGMALQKNFTDIAHAAGFAYATKGLNANQNTVSGGGFTTGGDASGGTTL